MQFAHVRKGGESTQAPGRGEEEGRALKRCVAHRWGPVGPSRTYNADAPAFRASTTSHYKQVGKWARMSARPAPRVSLAPVFAGWRGSCLESARQRGAGQGDS